MIATLTRKLGEKVDGTFSFSFQPPSKVQISVTGTQTNPLRGCDGIVTFTI